MRLRAIFRRLFGPHDAARDDEFDAARDDAFDAATDEGEADPDPYDPFPEPVRLEIRDVFDLHSIPPREVRAVVEAYLDEARSAGFKSVRIIHGKGVGVQRETVRRVLARTPFVANFSDAPPEAGGWGATIAHLHTEATREDEYEIEDDD